MNKNRFAVNLAFFICGFIYGTWTTRLPRIQDMFSLTNSTLGLILLCVAVGSLCSMPLTGWLITQRGSKFATSISVLLFSVVLIPFPYLNAVWQLAAGFYLLGCFTGALDVAMNMQAVAVEQKYNQPMMSSFHAIFSVGLMLGALNGSFFAKYFNTLQAHFTIVSLVCVGLCCVAIPLLINDSVSAEKREKQSFLLPNKAMLILGLIAFCGMLAEGSIADWSTNYLINVVKTDEVIAPIGLSIFSGTMTIGRFVGDKARTTFGDTKLLFMSSLMATLGLLFALSFINYWVFFAGLLLVGLGLAVIIPIVYSQAGNDTQLPQGIALAMVTTLGYSGFLAGPPIIGFLADWQGLRAALFFVVVLLALLTFLSIKQLRQDLK